MPEKQSFQDTTVPPVIRRKLFDVLRATVEQSRLVATGREADELDQILFELTESDQTLDNGQPVYQILAAEEETPESSEVLSPELASARVRLQAELAEAAHHIEEAADELIEKMEHPEDFSAPSSPIGDKIITNSEFGGTLSLRGVEPPRQTGSSEPTLPASEETESSQSPASQTAKSPLQQGLHVKLRQHVPGGSMADLSGYRDLSKAPLPMGEDHDDYGFGAEKETGFDRPPVATFSTAPTAPSFETVSQDVDTEFSGNVKTLIRLVNELPEGVTKQTGAQIIRLTMEAMGISMEDVLSEAQSAQSEMLDAVRANIKKIEEYKTVIRKLETDIKYYQGKANELSEIIDLFILSNTTGSRTPSADDLNA